MILMYKYAFTTKNTAETKTHREKEEITNEK